VIKTKLADFLRLLIKNTDQYHTCVHILLKTILCLKGMPSISNDSLMDHVGVNDMLEQLFLRPHLHGASSSATQSMWLVADWDKKRRISHSCVHS